MRGLAAYRAPALAQGGRGRGLSRRLPDPLTLGQVLRQARQQQRYTLATLAQRVQKPDGTPVSPQYLSDIEHDRRTPSLGILHALARALDLDVAGLLARLQRAEDVVRAYLIRYPSHEDEVILFFRKAMNLHFRNWPAFIQQL